MTAPRSPRLNGNQGSCAALSYSEPYRYTYCVATAGIIRTSCRGVLLNLSLWLHHLRARAASYRAGFKNGKNVAL